MDYSIAVFIVVFCSLGSFVINVLNYRRKNVENLTLAIAELELAVAAVGDKVLALQSQVGNSIDPAALQAATDKVTGLTNALKNIVTPQA